MSYLPKKPTANRYTVNTKSGSEWNYVKDWVHMMGEKKLRRLFENTDNYQVALRIYMSCVNRNTLQLGEDIMSTTTLTHYEEVAESLLENFYTIGAKFLGEDGLGKGTRYTFKVPKDMILEKNDYVLIMVGNLYKPVVVSEVDKYVQTSNRTKSAWIVQKIDPTKYQALIELDAKTVELVREMEKRRSKRKILEEFAPGLHKDDIKALEDLGVNLDGVITKE